MNEFKFVVGDIVIGNKLSDGVYGVTNSHRTCKVLEIIGDKKMIIRVISDKAYRNSRFTVFTKYFVPKDVKNFQKRIMDGCGYVYS
jgi:hypothetical protein